MRFLRHSLTGLFLLSLTLGLLTYAGYIVFRAVEHRLAKETAAPDRHERVFAVNVVRAGQATVTPILKAFGEIQSRKTLEIRAKVGGTILELAENFEDGGQVARGQLLARIDPADAESALKRTENDLLDARAELRDSNRALLLANDEKTAAQEQATLRERAYNRQVDLEARGVGTAAAVEVAELAAAQARMAVLASRQALALAETRVDQATTRLARTQISLAEAKRRLEDTRIVAGFDGTLSEVSVVEGGLVSQNEKLAHLVDGNALEVAFRVSTPQYARLLAEDGHLIHAQVTVTLDIFGVDLTAEGRISRDSAIVGSGQTGRLIYARLRSAPGLKPGDFVTVTVAEPPLENVTRLPASALGADGTVLALDPKDRLFAVPVSLLRRQGEDILVRAEALPGLDVVSERSPLLGEGIKVRPLRGKTDTSGNAVEMVELTDIQRARLRNFIQSNTDMSEAVKLRLLGQLEHPRVPARMVRRLESRMDG